MAQTAKNSSGPAVRSQGRTACRSSFRMEGSEVRIRRQGRNVILEPLAEDWAWLDAIAGRFSDDFLRGRAATTRRTGTGRRWTACSTDALPAGHKRLYRTAQPERSGLRGPCSPAARRGHRPSRTRGPTSCTTARSRVGARTRTSPSSTAWRSRSSRSMQSDARAAGAVRADLERSGRPIGPYDVLIAWSGPRPWPGAP